jgi:fatty acid/phospholipid synthesis protein PlsX
MRIILDGMGGDDAPVSIIEGAIAATAEISDDDDIVIVGKEDIICECLEKYSYKGSQISVVNAEEVITNDEAPVKAVRHKKDSSVVRGITMVKEGDGDVFISAGSTGAILAGGLLILGRITGIDRPTLAAVYPVIGSEPSLLTDTGANAECKAKNLLEFGVMGSIYMQSVLGRQNPTVGLVNNGTEAGKGTPLTKEAYALMEQSNLNFIGNVETRDLQNAICDVIVTDGFTGNAIVKLTEGMGLMVLRELKKRFLSTSKSKLGALLLKDQLSQIKKEFNYAEYGGAPILGVKGALLKMHGSSDALAVKQTIMKAIPYVEEDVVGTIERAMENVQEMVGDE